MKRNWELDELIEHFTFLPNEMQQMGNKSSETRIGFAVMFKFFQYEARFPFINLKYLRPSFHTSPSKSKCPQNCMHNTIGTVG
ncbi:hypothetical protein LWE69_17700 [Paenibacillus sp. UKAQ_18]|nr:hypothetical protein [Paenibacillus sp. UKAQ_18]